MKKKIFSPVMVTLPAMLAPPAITANGASRAAPAEFVKHQKKQNKKYIKPHQLLPPNAGQLPRKVQGVPEIHARAGIAGSMAVDI